VTLEDAGETQQGDRVMLATIHAAKGLEFGCVRVVGLEEGMLPQHRWRARRSRRSGGSATWR
jgi:superfamily I DNA/RNA helicase